MRSRMLKFTVAVLLVFTAFLFLSKAGNGMEPGSGGVTYSKYCQDAAADADGRWPAQSLTSGNHLQTGALDGAWTSENRGGTVSFLKNGRAEEESAMFLFNLILLLSVLQFLPNGTLWSAIRSICMDFQNYAMHQLQILQLWDGKKKGFFYS